MKLVRLRKKILLKVSNRAPVPNPSTVDSVARPPVRQGPPANLVPRPAAGGIGGARPTVHFFLETPVADPSDPLVTFEA